MALYKYAAHMGTNNDAIFDAVQKPGEAASRAGIFRCIVCGYEIGIAEGHTLPPQTHHAHPTSSQPIQWRLQVYAQHAGS